MTLIKYNKKTVPTKTLISPALKFHRNDAFCLNASAVELTGFKKGDKVSIVNEIRKEGLYENSEWYLVLDEDGYELKGNANRDFLNLHNKTLARTVLDKNNLPGNVYSIKIAPKSTILEDGTVGWCLLMGSAIK